MKHTVWEYNRTAPSVEEFIEDYRMTIVWCKSATRWERLKIALAFLLTPLTVVLFGQSITVTLKWRSPPARS